MPVSCLARKPMRFTSAMRFMSPVPSTGEWGSGCAYDREVTDLDTRIIDSLRRHHVVLAVAIADLNDAQLGGASGAEEWTIADVLSHMGSGAEIMLVPLQAAIDGSPQAESDKQAVWDRWNAMSPRDQATGFLEHDARLLETVEALSSDQRSALRVDLGFLPEPMSLEVADGMRLNEVAQHVWDVRVGLDAAAILDPEAAEILLELFSGELGFLLGFTSKTDVLTEPTEVAIRDYSLVIENDISLKTAPMSPTAAFDGPLESAVRLMGGRLKPEHTPVGVQVTGNVTIDELREVFPGF